MEAPSAHEHWSNFHVTINTNTHSNEGSPIGVAHDLAEAVHQMINDPLLVWQWLYRYNPNTRRRAPFAVDDRFLVTGIRARVALERGENKHNTSIHAHVLLEVRHQTFVQIHYQGMKDYLEAALGHGVHVYCRFLKGSGDDAGFILNYILKQTPARLASRANRRVYGAMTQGVQPAYQPVDNDDVV